MTFKTLVISVITSQIILCRGPVSLKAYASWLVVGTSVYVRGTITKYLVRLHLY